MERFTMQIKELRNEIISAIVEIMNNANVNKFDFTDEIEMCERCWQVCYDGNGEPHECFITKVELDEDGENLVIYANTLYDADFVILTSCHFEAKQVDFLNDLYQNIVYYLTKK